VYIASDGELVFLLASMLMLLVFYRARYFLNLLRRMRWLLFFLVIIYVFNTPGEFIQAWPFYVAPTYEGINAAAKQLGKLLIMLGGISLLIATTPRDDLMTGFFVLLSPLKYIGLDPDRLAVRLWLTLHYVDHAPRIKSVSDFLAAFDNVSREDPDAAEMQSLHISIPEAGWKDILAIAIMAGAIYLI
jgi:energy-coupling factor transporter transmembrane protein EcfT